MNKRIVLLILSLISLYCVQSQNYKEKFGKLSPEEFGIKPISWDTTAEAVVLFDYGTSCFIELANNYEILFERMTRIKIFNEAGLKYANIEIPFYRGDREAEIVKDIQVNVYNIENGSFMRNTIDNVDYYDEKINEHWTLRKFAIPNVKAGSMIEYKYTLQSPCLFNLQDWNFQWRIPVLCSEYVVKLVPFYQYQYIIQGVDKLDILESYVETGFGRQFGSQRFNDVVNRFALKNVPAFRDEEFITSINDYLIKIDFQLYQVTSLDGVKNKIITTWPDLIKELIKDSNFGKFIDKSEKMAEKLFNINEVMQKGQKERFDFVVNYVKSNYKWNGTNEKFTSNTLTDLIEKKQGNSAEINLLLIGLLRAVNIDVLPVISSTREHGQIKYDLPFIEYFNYVLGLANVDGQMFLADATDLNCPNNRIPFRCINDRGLVLKKDEVAWIGLQGTVPSILKSNIKINITDSLMTSEIESSLTEYDALFYRQKYSNDKEKMLKDLNSKGYDVDEQTLNVKNYSEINLPYVIKFKSINRTNVIGNKIYVSPFLSEAISENPLKQTKSSYPVDMAYLQKKVYNSFITIPDGYKVDYKGQNLSFQNELYSIEYKTYFNEKQIIVQLSYEFKKSVYPAEDYPKIKNSFDEIVGKIKEKVVFSKI